jgi:hypothetical protein
VPVRALEKGRRAEPILREPFVNLVLETDDEPIEFPIRQVLKRNGVKVFLKPSDFQCASLVTPQAHVESIRLCRRLPLQVGDKSIHEIASIRSLRQIPKPNVVAVDPSRIRRRWDIGQHALALLGKSSSDPLVSTGVANATYLGADHGEEHSIDLFIRRWLALHETLWLWVSAKEFGSGYFRNSASDAAPGLNVKRTEHTPWMAFTVHNFACPTYLAISGGRKPVRFIG